MTTVQSPTTSHHKPSFFVVCLFVATLVVPATLSAQETGRDSVDKRVARLSLQLKAPANKTRIAAAISLSKLRDKRTLQALLYGLQDKSAVVRAVCASALGNLGDPHAIPSLTYLTNDPDKNVRRQAKRSLELLSKQETVVARRQQPRRRQGQNLRPANFRVKAQESPRLSPRNPELFVAIRSAVDDSGEHRHKRTRNAWAQNLRKLMAKELASARHITMSPSTAQDLHLPKYSVDLSLTRLRRIVRGPWVELECELRVTISNEEGRMMSFLTGGAKVQVAAGTFQTEFLASMRKEALENAVKNVRLDLARHLRTKSGV